jgi:hypothetical protein
MNDKFGWGIWKTFNVVVLTAWGSGAFAVGIAAWVFGRKRLHTLMRMALLTSMLAYACGLCLLGVDVGRPWNFYWVLFPWNWNVHSPMAEVAICMSVYASIPLFLENIPPILERLWHFDVRCSRRGETRTRPAQILPLHRCLGVPVARHAPVVPGRLDAAGRDSEFIPCGRRRFCPCCMWALPPSCRSRASPEPRCCVAWFGSGAMDMEVLDEAARITAWTIFGWLAIRNLDLLFRGALFTAFHFTATPAFSGSETFLIGYGGWLLLQSLKITNCEPCSWAMRSVRWAACSIASAPRLWPTCPAPRDVFPVHHRTPDRDGFRFHRASRSFSSW